MNRNERQSLGVTLRQDWPLVALIATTFLVGAALYPHLPEQVPGHWNVAGEVDRYISRFWGAFLGPLVSLGVYLLMVLLPALDPRQQNYGKFGSSYRVLRLAIPAVLIIIYLVSLAAALDSQINVGMVVQALVSILFIIIGNVMGRIRPTFFVGIRTPWTLADDEVWRKTHRLAAPLWVLAGFLGLVTAILPPPWNALGLLVPLFLAAIVPVVYSYLIYRGR
ncbi:MAG: SdpI family protein [bacterium]